MVSISIKYISYGISFKLFYFIRE
ncbi:hypothetical protein PSEUDO9AZ_20842 [Pseudomonas sp. 9AZ]|nr:hypothetical protein PSEUDO9AZ_20842 [Pseudomonas sp. 9AZ]